MVIRHREGDVLLSSTGKRQIAFELTTKASDFPSVRKVFCSPLRRALLSAIAAYPKHKIIVEPRLKEVGASSGLTLRRLQAWLKKVRPKNLQDVDLSRVEAGVWWGAEDESEAEKRLQSFLADIRRLPGKVAVFGHSVAFQTMASFSAKRFPRAWGTRRGWPKNFKPYYANIVTRGFTSVEAAPPRSANVVLVRHAHSRNQAARTAKKRRLKEEASKANRKKRKK